VYSYDAGPDVVAQVGELPVPALAAYADRLIDLVRAFKKIPALIDRIDEYYPPPGAAPPPPPLPDIAVSERRYWWG